MEVVQASHSPRFFARQIIGILSKMELGRLEMRLPGGTLQTFGNGSGEGAYMEVKSWNFFRRLVLYGDVGFGESFVAGEWETDSIARVISFFVSNYRDNPAISGGSGRKVFLNLLRGLNRVNHLVRANSRSMSEKNIHEHYDLSNDFFSLFLDESMTYSSGIFENPEMTLSEAQINKYETLARSCSIKPGQEVLEIGCGWGSNAILLAQKFGAKVRGITISRQQYDYSLKKVQAAGLSEQISIEFCDYRDAKGSFDHIVSVEMLEAVGDRYFDVYFKKCSELLKPGGSLGFQVITCPDSRYAEIRDGIDWIQKHIFPGSLLPSVARINQAVNNTGKLNLTSLKEFGSSYAKTLNLWHRNFDAKKEAVLALGFDEPFIKKWKYYLGYCEAAFAMKNIYVMQMVYREPNFPVL
jgi:cyclopropane-fatty-acyl-phospholipid synthase